MKLKALPSMLTLLPSVLGGVTLEDLERIKRITRNAFPGVAQISTATLADWMEASKPLLLIDVRHPAEFAVSQLGGARNLHKVSLIADALKKMKPERTVLYCSVGFRSSQMAARLPHQEEF